MLHVVKNNAHVYYYNIYDKIMNYWPLGHEFLLYVLLTHSEMRMRLKISTANKDLSLRFQKSNPYPPASKASRGVD